MSYTLFFLMKGKLISTDDTFPIVAGLRNAGFKNKIKFIYPSKNDLEIIKKNKDYYNTLLEVVSVKSFYSVDDFKLNKSFRWLAILLSILQRNLILSELLFSKKIIFKIEKIPRINWLIKFNKKVWSGKEVVLYLNTMTFKVFLKWLKNVRKDGRSLDIYERLFKGENDLIISSFNKNQLKLIDKRIEKNADILTVGNTRLWSSWKCIINRLSREEIKKLPKKFVFFPLAIIKRKLFGEYLDLTDSVKLIIETINKIDPTLHLVFRPHPTTNILELKKIIKSTKLKRYTVSMLHTTILIDRCIFVVKYGLSSLDSIIIHQNKHLIRYQNKKLAQMFNEQIHAEAELKKKYFFYDVYNEKDLFLMAKNTYEKIIKCVDKKNNSNIANEKANVSKVLKFINQS